MATHSSILAWRIPWIGEPGGLQFTGSQGVGHDWATNTQTHAHTYTQVVVWIRKWQPTRVLLPGESQGLGSLVGSSLWGRKESDMTEWLTHTHTVYHFASFWILSALRHEELEFLRAPLSPDAFFPVSEELEQALIARPVIEHPDPVQ